MLQVFENGELVCVRAHYHPEFPGHARLLDGRWTGEVWSFPLARENEVRALCRRTYGDDGSCPSELVCLRVEVTVPCSGGPFEQLGTGLYLGGREIARAHPVGRRARTGKGVTFLRMAPARAGSAEYPLMIIPHGAVFEVEELSPGAAEMLRAQVGDYGTVIEVQPPVGGDHLR